MGLKVERLGNSLLSRNSLIAYGSFKKRHVSHRKSHAEIIFLKDAAVKRESHSGWELEVQEYKKQPTSWVSPFRFRRKATWIVKESG